MSIPANPDATRTDGVKQYLQLAGEMIFSGPSPLMKSAFERAEHRKVYAPGMKAEKTPDVDVTETAAKSAADADEAIADTPESILGAFEAGVLSKDEAAKRLHSWSDKRAAWAERKLAELSVKTIRNQLEV